jgi:hypothetical protein
MRADELSSKSSSIRAVPEKLLVSSLVSRESTTLQPTYTESLDISSIDLQPSLLYSSTKDALLLLCLMIYLIIHQLVNLVVLMIWCVYPFRFLLHLNRNVDQPLQNSLLWFHLDVMVTKVISVVIISIFTNDTQFT